MKFSVYKSIAIFLLLLSPYIHADTPTKESIVDPLFGLELKITKLVNLELEKTKIRQIGLNTKGTYWILSSYKQEGIIYQIIVGLHPVFEDSTDKSLLGFDSDFGSVVMGEVKTKQYMIVGTPDVVFDYIPNNPIGNGALQALSNNYVSTLAEILGKDIQLTTQLAQSGVELESLSPIIKESILNYHK